MPHCFSRMICQLAGIGKGHSAWVDSIYTSAAGFKNPRLCRFRQVASSIPLPNGGSRNRISNPPLRGGRCRINLSTGPATISITGAITGSTAVSAAVSTACPARNFSQFARNIMTASGWDSTMTTFDAPREAASKPKAPLPANKSRQDLWRRLWGSQLNRVSRTASGDGRKPTASTQRTRRRLH